MAAAFLLCLLISIVKSNSDQLLETLHFSLTHFTSRMSFFTLIKPLFQIHMCSLFTANLLFQYFLFLAW